MEEVTAIYKAKADALQATLDKVEEDMQQRLSDLQNIRQTIAEMDEKFGLTEGKGSQHELLELVRRNFPDFAESSDEDILSRFGDSYESS